jgi:predicted membrane protein
MPFTSAMAMVEEMPEAITINGTSYATAGAGPDAQIAVARLMFLQGELQRLAALMEELDANRTSVLEQLQVVLSPS